MRFLTHDIHKLYKKKIIPLICIGHMAMSPLLDMLLLPKGVTYLEGKPESGKTLTAELFMNMAWDWPIGKEGAITFGSTPNSVEVNYMWFRGTPILLDDAKISLMKKDYKTWMRMIQSYYGRTGRGRLNPDLSSKNVAVIVGNLLITGEDHPFDQESVLTRMVTVSFPMDTLDIEGFRKLAQDRHVLSSLWPYYIAWLQRQENLEVKHYAPQSWGRLQSFINNLGTGLEYYLQFLHEEFGISEKVVQKHLDTFRAESLPLIADNQYIQHQTRDTEMFTQQLAEILCGNYSFIDDTPGLTVQKLGYREGNTIYLYPGLALKKVSDALGGHEFSKTSLARRLLEEGYLDESAGCNKSKDGTIRPRSDNNPTRQRVWPIKADKLFEGYGDPENNPNSQFL